MSNNIHFEKLTPTNDYKLGIYEKAMDFVFSSENDDILNVAITGPYASGKSSMIETYKKKHLDKKFIHISLAHFEKQGKTEEEKSQEEAEDADGANDNESSKANRANIDYTLEEENRLEGKIINQLIHKINPKNIPQTNFNIKKKMEKKEVKIRTTVSSVFIGLILYIVFFKSWYTTVSNMNVPILKPLLKITLNTEALIIAGLICFAIAVWGIYKSIEKQQFTKSLKKLNIQGNEIEIFGDNNESYFDKYLNEVLYIINNSQADAIVFEDIDRYNSGLIFEKLREISNLVNSKYNIVDDKKENTRKEEADKKIIKFIYLIKDDMFASKDRTKFFDYIIPIIPVVDSSNSYDKFIEQFKKGNLFELIDEDFFKDISLYVDDMRLLKNIYNEFCVYYIRLKKDSLEENKKEKPSLNLDNNKLLGMIIYKNIFPKDFSDLQLGQGFVYCVFKSKDKLIEEEVERLKKEIDSIQRENKSINLEQLNSIDELDACYFTYNGRIGVNNKEEQQFNSKIEFIKELKKNEYNGEEYTYSTYYGRYTSNSCNLKLIFDGFQNKDEYKKRKKLIENKNNNMIEINNKKINELSNNLATIKGKYMKDLITRENIDKVFKDAYYENELNERDEFEEIKRSTYFPLIKYLIRNGRIDENYSDYMAYFYPNSLTYSDKEFLLSISNKKKKEYTYELLNCKLIVSRIKLADFLEEEILNCDLLSYLLKNSNIYKEQLHNFLVNIKDNKRIKFVSTFMEKKGNEQDKKIFVKKFNNQWDRACKWIAWSEEFDKNMIREYMQKTILYSEDYDIAVNNYETDYKDMVIFPVKDYIDKDSEFLNMQPENNNRVIDVFKMIEINMEDIDYEKSNKDLFMEVYKNDLYEINYKMISLILKEVYKIPENKDYNEKNYSLIMSSEEQPLSQYINDNINEYVKVILDEKPNKITDQLEVALKLINNTELKDEFKYQYIGILETKITKLKEVNSKELWTKLLDRNIVDTTDENLLDYYFEKDKKLDESVITFINDFRNEFEFDSDTINQIYGENADYHLFQAILQSNEINNDKYKELLKKFNRYNEGFNVKCINGDKINILIDLKIIRMNTETLNFMRSNYKENIIKYILSEIDEYIKLCEDNFVYEEMLDVIEENIGEDKKIKLVGLSDKAISIKDKKYSSELKEYVLKEKFDENDLEYIIDIYSSENINLKEAIEEIVEDNIDKIIEKKYVINYELLIQLLKYNKLDIKQKKQLITISIKQLQKREMYNCFEIMGADEFMHLFNGDSSIEIAVDEANEQLLDVLKAKDIVKSYEVIEDENGVQSFNVSGKR